MLRALGGLMLLLGTLVLLPAPLALAQGRGEQAEATLRESTWKALREALDALEAGKEAEAAQLLEALAPRTRDRPFEYAVVRQAQGLLLLQQERPREALEAFRGALEGQRLPPEVTHEIRRHIARIHIVLEEYEAAIAALAELPKNPPDAEALLLEGHALFRLERWQAAARTLTAAIRASPAPPLAWRELQLAAWLHAEDFPQATAVLLDLVALEPTRADWWRQLASVLQRLGAHRAAAAVLAAASRIGLLGPSELLDLGRLLLYTEQPQRAARLLAEAFGQGRFREMEEEALLLLADAWALAREPARAIAHLEPVAATAGPALLGRLGRLQFNEARWEAAWQSLERAAQAEPASGSEAARAENLLLAGIAALQAGRREAAIGLLQQADRSTATRERARRWLARARQAG